ncbi:hypothetical protein [Arthrobacter sp. HS15c]|uniref:hypothetical protein n=1 Tax=Arthrobacter sp. HS15c TaxID=3230279 RepID=UPI0034659EFD
MIVFIDPYEGRGGGQAVLEEILGVFASRGHELLLAMPAAGRSKIVIPESVETCEISQLESVIADRPSVLVSNANSSHIKTLIFQHSLRKKGNVCRAIAILHNYPRNRLRKFAVKTAVARFDAAIAVEPGLSILRSDVVIPSWLSAAPKQPVISRDRSFDQKIIKCFARPDPSKGLHLLPGIFAAMERLGFTCQVALGDALESNSRYVTKLTSDLSPWLVRGRRGPEWLEPGDIFIIPSVYGEAACLSAQEAMSRGAFVVASRVGLMPYLSPTNEGIRTFGAGSEKSAIAVLEEVAKLESSDFQSECLAGAREISRRNGRWYSDVAGLLSQEDSKLVVSN